MDKHLVLQGCANKLWAAENSIDTAIADASKLMVEMVEARQALRVSSTVDAKCSAKVVEAMALLSQARTAMVEAHDEMTEVKLRLGVRAKMIGAFDKSKDNGVTTDSLSERLAG